MPKARRQGGEKKEKRNLRNGKMKKNDKIDANKILFLLQNYIHHPTLNTMSKC